MTGQKHTGINDLTKLFLTANLEELMVLVLEPTIGSLILSIVYFQ